KAGRTQVALPAVLNWGQSSWLSIVRHGALILFLVGLPFFALALADPYSTLTQEDVSFPGRRIALMIDASSSMMARFPAARLDAAGNLMVIFSDGQDTQVMIHGKSVNEVLAGAVATKIPVYMIRTSYNKALGAVLPDDIWRPAVEATGGKFYAASDESVIFNAIKDIDARSAGRVEVK